MRSFAAAGDAAECRILFPASDRAASTLVHGLAALGAEVVRVEAYRTTVAALDLRSCLTAAARGEVDVLTFASPSSVDALADALAPTAFSVLLASAAVAAIGPTTAAALARRAATASTAWTLVRASQSKRSSAARARSSGAASSGGAIVTVGQ